MASRASARPADGGARRRRRLASVGAQPEVVSAFWKGIDVFRPIALAYAVYAAWDRQEQMVRPEVAWVVLAALGAWTAFLLFYRRRALWLVVAELVLAAAAIMATRLADSEAVIEAGAQTLPTIWPAAGVVSAAVLKGRKGGILAALFIGVVDVLEVQETTPHTINNIVLLLLVGALIGYAVELAREGHEKLREALLLEAQVRERERLARTVHDGVLQTLAFINRRGSELGGEATVLGGLAADQEQRLRALVTGTSEPEVEGAVAGEVDLRVPLARFAEGPIHVVAPADPVLVPERVGGELVAAVGAALDNVRQHAGDGAQAWVLVEDEGERVSLTVRDNGRGMPEGRLAEAAAAGRLGASSSICGRLADLGGEASFSAREGAGVTVRMWAPKRGERTSGGVA
jgi:signal transduction histidine kinase